MQHDRNRPSDAQQAAQLAKNVQLLFEKYVCQHSTATAWQADKMSLVQYNRAQAMPGGYTLVSWRKDNYI
jgi:hypothetical protein